jgi:hypothetical protein
LARIEDLSTPCLLLCREVLAANCTSMATRMRGFEFMNASLWL